MFSFIGKICMIRNSYRTNLTGQLRILQQIVVIYMLWHIMHASSPLQHQCICDRHTTSLKKAVNVHVSELLTLSLTQLCLLILAWPLWNVKSKDVLNRLCLIQDFLIYFCRYFFRLDIVLPTKFKKSRTKTAACIHNITPPFLQDRGPIL